MLPYQTRVFDAVEPEPRARHAPTERTFEGVLEGDTFRIHRIVRGRNSFCPELYGRIEATPTGRARAVVSFRLHLHAGPDAIREAGATGERRFLWHTGAMLALGILEQVFAGPPADLSLRPPLPRSLPRRSAPAA